MSTYNINGHESNPIKVISLFSGYDSPLLALNHMGIFYTLHCWSEIDRYAILAHDIAHPQLRFLNIGDITKAEPIKQPTDILFYSSPCQDFSKAGRNKGGHKGSGTRSSLLWHVSDFIQAAQPTMAILENVPGFFTIHQDTLTAWQTHLQCLGYYSTIFLLNCANTGIPQNRNRLFMISMKNTPPHIQLPIVLNKPWQDFLDTCPAPKHLYIDPKKITNLTTFDKTHYPKLLGYSKVYQDYTLKRYHEKNTFNTITTKNDFPTCNLIAESDTQIRRLSPSERLRIQGVPEPIIVQFCEHFSEKQINRLAGNSIPISMLELLLIPILDNIQNPKKS